MLTMAAVRSAFSEPVTAPTPDGARAAVLIGLSAPAGVAPPAPASVLLIRRAVHLRANPGEIAFPGGRIEPGESPLEAALREADEEVALRVGAVEVLGELPMVLASGRAVPVRPFVAGLADGLELEANRDEVDCVLRVALSELVAPGRYWSEQWDRGDDPAWVMHFFDLGEDVIWGATARMLYALFVRLLSRGSGGRKGGPPEGRTPPASRRTTTTR